MSSGGVSLALVRHPGKGYGAGERHTDTGAPQMAGITLAQAEAQLAAYLAAETAVLSGQMYQIAGRTMRRADLEQIHIGITTWDARVKALSSSAQGRTRARTIVPGG